MRLSSGEGGGVTDYSFYYLHANHKLCQYVNTPHTLIGFIIHENLCY